MKTEKFTIKEFGLGNKSVVFFFAGMGTRTWLYTFPINRLVRNGFRVIAFDFDALIVKNGTVDEFITIINEVISNIKARVNDFKHDGIYNFSSFGTSMGTLFAIKCAADIPEVSRVVINMTYGSVAENVWTWSFIKPAKERAIREGYTLQTLDKKLEPISPIPNAHKLRHKTVLLYLSKRDKILLYTQSVKFKQALDKAGIVYQYVENKHFGHIISGYNNFRRYKVWLNFLLKT